MPEPAQPVSTPAEPFGRLWRDRAARQDMLAVAALGLVVAMTIRGHFAMPHPDFHEFLDSGHALLSGELPPTMKRAPLFGLVVVALAAPLPVEAAEQHVTEWLNLLLLPFNAGLIYVIGRAWFGPAARWAAAWFTVLPFSLYCTAHVFVEPLLTCMILLTVRFAQRGSGWMYLAAGLATLTRYDAAGLIAGVFVADLMQGRRWAGAIVRTAAAAAPLGLWMLLTWLTWSERSYDHYLAQIDERPVFNLAWAAWLPFQTVADFDALRLPAWLFAIDNSAVTGSWILAAMASAVGCVAGLWRRRDAAMAAAAIAFACYVGVHAIFPFKLDRFGYPVSPLVILAAGAGIHEIAIRLRPYAGSVRAGLTTLLVIAGVLVVLALIGEAEAFLVRTGWRNPWSVTLTFLVVLAAAVLWAGPMIADGRRLRQIVLYLAFALAATVLIRSSLEWMGSGQGLKNQVEAARWIRQNAPPTARVLSGSPGMMRLYAGREPPDRFLAFQDIEAESWPGILEECRRRGIEYIIWHDRLYQEHGGYYAEKWRLSRFEALKPLASPPEPGEAAASMPSVPGVELERRFANFPNLVVLRVERRE